VTLTSFKFPVSICSFQFLVSSVRAKAEAEVSEAEVPEGEVFEAELSEASSLYLLLPMLLILLLGNGQVGGRALND
jgi:hypothetical protein